MSENKIIVPIPEVNPDSDYVLSEGIDCGEKNKENIVCRIEQTYCRSYWLACVAFYKGRTNTYRRLLVMTGRKYRWFEI